MLSLTSVDSPFLACTPSGTFTIGSLTCTSGTQNPCYHLFVFLRPFYIMLVDLSDLINYPLFCIMLFHYSPPYLVSPNYACLVVLALFRAVVIDCSKAWIVNAIATTVYSRSVVFPDGV